MAGYTTYDYQDIELRKDPDPFGTSCHISSMTEKYRSKTLFKPNSPLK